MRRAMMLSLPVIVDSAARRRLLSWLSLSSLLLGSAAWGEDRFVDSASPTPTAPYTTANTAAHEIQQAIDAAAERDVVKVAAGTYKIESTVQIKGAITLLGVAGAEKTTIDADGKCQAVSLGKGATLIGLTVTGGKAREGGGVHCGGGTTVAECVIKDNTAERFGGGISVRVGGKKPDPCLIRDSQIIGNRVTESMHTDTPWGGGGLYVSQSTTVRNCRIENNEAAQRGGGIWLHSGDAVAENCIIIGNRARGQKKRNPNGPGSMEEGGGGAYCDFGGFLRGCLITNNHANKIGGGAVLSTSGRAKNCTFAANTAGLSGGGVQTLGGATLINSIVYGNTQGGETLPDDVAMPDDVYVSHYYHVDVHQLMLGKANLKHCCLGAVKLHETKQRFYLGPTAGYDPKWYKNTANRTEVIEADPKFVDPKQQNYRIEANSPCLDAGTLEDWMKDATDLDGKPRIQGAGVDLGAYERAGGPANVNK